LLENEAAASQARDIARNATQIYIALSSSQKSDMLLKRRQVMIKNAMSVRPA
jgi:hypothetical protein